jgi:hypothetical protein
MSTDKYITINKKKLICYSILSNKTCNYGSICAYAHNLAEQNIDSDKMDIYRIIFDKHLMNFFVGTNAKTDDIYKKLLFYTYLCKKCKSNKCTGGYNCKYGAFNASIKLCKNDLLTGQCLNKIVDIDMDQNIIDKITDIEKSDSYKGCINGHHLSERGLLPYYKYVHQKENTTKCQYDGVRHINEYLRSKCCDNVELSSSSDEELHSWFRQKYIDEQK